MKTLSFRSAILFLSQKKRETVVQQVSRLIVRRPFSLLAGRGKIFACRSSIAWHSGEEEDMALARSVGNLGVLEIAAAAILVLLAGERTNIDILNEWQYLFSEVRYSTHCTVCNI